MEESLIENAEDVNALTLAYLGDAVFELEVRKRMLLSGSKRVDKLHKRVTAFVNAASQSRLFSVIEPLRSEAELAVYRRGRNSKTLTAAKHQSIADYRRATGFEAVFGYLYLNGSHDRIAELIDKCFEAEDEEIME